jgi:hypothetical protein
LSASPMYDVRTVTRRLTDDVIVRYFHGERFYARHSGMAVVAPHRFAGSRDKCSERFQGLSGSNHKGRLRTPPATAARLPVVPSFTQEQQTFHKRQKNDQPNRFS